MLSITTTLTTVSGRKVWTFWEAHKIWKNLPRGLYIYLVNIQSMRKIFSSFVCFSESPNFNWQHSCNLSTVLMDSLSRALFSIQLIMLLTTEVKSFLNCVMPLFFHIMKSNLEVINYCHDLIIQNCNCLNLCGKFINSSG